MVIAILLKIELPGSATELWGMKEVKEPRITPRFLPSAGKKGVWFCYMSVVGWAGIRNEHIQGSV